MLWVNSTGSSACHLNPATLKTTGPEEASPSHHTDSPGLKNFALAPFPTVAAVNACLTRYRRSIPTAYSNRNEITQKGT
jgi:hypothetical protein